MRLAPQDRLEAAARTKTAPFTSWRFVGINLRHIQIIPADAEILFRIGYRRFKQLENIYASPLIGKAKRLERLICVSGRALYQSRGEPSGQIEAKS